MKRQNLLAMCVAGIMTSMIATTVSQASDIEIYQEAKSGDITLMFLIDVSGSMAGSSSYDGTGQDRIVRVKNAMKDLLQGNTSKGILQIDDDKIIGLATLATMAYGSYSSSGSDAAMVVPARRLGETIGGKTQRQILLEEVNKLGGVASATPTGVSYLETIAYMLGNTGNGNSYSRYARPETKSTNSRYLSPSSLTQSDDLKKCSGQGIYVLTDGEPNGGAATQARGRTALGNNSLSCNGNWNCIQQSTLAFLDPTQNSKNLKLKTAVVGFGSSFNSIPSYDKTKTQAENLAPFINANGTKKTNLSNVQEAAYWGIIGEGGWYSGNSSQDVVDSVNEFINSLATEIPSVTTGTPTIPVDQLNTTIVQNYAYYPQFQPTPDKSYQLWLGNLKKYNAKDNGLRDKNNSKIVDNKGKLLANYDLWSPTISSNTAIKDADENTIGSTRFALSGGVRSQLELKALANSTKIVNRKLLTNRLVTGSDTNPTIGQDTTLRAIELDYLTKASYKGDPARGYLMNLLGYAVDPLGGAALTIENLRKAADLRQVGAVMHSNPVLITNEGKITYDETTGKTGSTNRKDYILFGSTQGLLHVVDAESGKEKFAFVPNEMIESQKQAFTIPESNTAGIKSLYYGIDAPWTTYTEYVLTGSDGLTVDSGKNSQKGKQIAYGGLRMGGKSYYALDLADIDNPKLLFQIDPAQKKVHYNNGSKTVSELQYMGQSWSKPSVAWVRWNGERKLVMFVGGGYDAEGINANKSTTQKASDKYKGYEYPDYAQDNGIGGGVYMFDAQNGDLLWWASAKASDTTSGNTNGPVGKKVDSLKYSVASEIRTVDRNSDGLIDHLYFGDLGGQVFRIDLNNELKKDQKNQFFTRAVRLLNLQNGEYSPRFYEMPAFSIYDYNGQPFGVVSIGSGNRSLPLADYTTGSLHKDDAIYNLYDKDVARVDLYDTTKALSTPDRTTNNSNHLEELTDTDRFTTTTNRAPYGKAGWYYPFKSFKQQSEKVLSTPIVIKSDMFVSTFDGSKPGLSGDCGAGVKGESFATLFCMPYGQCSTGTKDSYRLPLGVGITGAAVGGKEGGDTRVIVANVDTTGGSGGSAILGKEYSVSNLLVVQRWYEKL